MIESRFKLLIMVLGLSVALAFGAPQLAFAQDGDDAAEAAEEAAESAEDAAEESAFGEEIVVTGSRAQPRSVTESMVFRSTC